MEKIPPLYNPHWMSMEPCVGVEKAGFLKVKGVLEKPALVRISTPVDLENPTREVKKRVVGCLYGVEEERGRTCLLAKSRTKWAPCRLSNGESRSDPERHEVTEAHLAKIIEALESVCPVFVPRGLL